ncbi:MAG: NAD(P)H-hydrate dehydratase [Candidatus Altiarchaeales archaeon]|nr:NAD(P)H-hydrate dehydratase [Candidatus Altiarchaeales archaeon]MBD3416661.1 NAD(P)H-hydrate dehydratase [Candidatus Altiarchaeales archaeon]
MDSRALDLNAVWLGVPLERLMENAGAAVARECAGFKRIAIFCGRGNNGGDGLVAARILHEDGVDVTVFALEGDRTKLNQNNLGKIPDSLKKIIDNREDFELEGFDLIVDALVGVGLEGEAREPLKGVIEKMNESHAHKISVDTPSAGIVEADAVVSLHTAKVPGAIVADIGIPAEAERYCGPGDVAVALPRRKSDSRKGDHGRLIVMGGCREYIGTPTLVAQAALKSGVDLVTVCVPQYVADKMPFDPNLIVHPLKSSDAITAEDVKEVLGMKCDAIVFGNGLGRESREAAKWLMEKSKVPLVLDADALSLAKKRWLKDNMIVTPHEAEYRRLFGRLEDREENVLADSRETGAVIVLKGSEDTISDGETVRLNRTGDPNMTVGGTGDVLAGVIGSLLAQTGDRMKAACAGAYLTGRSGELASEELGVSMTATDVIAKIPEAIGEVRDLG